MHDASGCNSTYNTHDEPRWYDSDSLVFLSGLTEMEAILGDDQRLSADIVAAARELQPRFIAIAGSPIPALTGCDLPAIAAGIEAETGICTFGFATTGMQSYVTGAGMALAAVARRLTKPVPRAKTPTVNLLGATPLDFPLHGAIPDMIAWLQEAGYRVQSTWAMGSTLEELCSAGAAWVNLVISSTGLPAAQALQEKFGDALCRRYPGRAGVWACPAGAPGLQCPHGTQQRGLCRLRARWRGHYSRRSRHGPFPGGGHRPGARRGAAGPLPRWRRRLACCRVATRQCGRSVTWSSACALPPGSRRTPYTGPSFRRRRRFIPCPILLLPAGSGRGRWSIL